MSFLWHEVREEKAGGICRKVRLFTGALRNFLLESAEVDQKIKPAFCWFYKNILLL